MLEDHLRNISKLPFLVLFYLFVYLFIYSFIYLFILMQFTLLKILLKFFSTKVVYIVYFSCCETDICPYIVRQRTGRKGHVLLSDLLYTHGGIILEKRLFDRFRNVHPKISLSKIIFKHCHSNLSCIYYNWSVKKTQYFASS